MLDDHPRPIFTLHYCLIGKEQLSECEEQSRKEAVTQSGWL